MAGRLIFILAGALATAAPAAEPVATPVLAHDGYRQVIERVADGVWLIRQPEPFHLQPIGNVTVIEQEKGLVLIDGAGSPGAGRRVAELVKSVSSKPVTHIVVTHWHGDHTLGLTGVLESWPSARILASEATRAALLGKSMGRYAKGAADPARTAAFVKDLDGFEPFLDGMLKKPELSAEERAGFARTKRELAAYKIDVDGLHVPTQISAYRATLTLYDPVRPVELFQPGLANTDGDTAAWLPQQRLLVSGDIVVMPVPFGFGSYPVEWVAALQKLKARNFALLIPGHGAVQHDSAYIDRLIVLIEEVRAKVGPLARQGVSLDETRKQVSFAEQRRAFAGSDAWLGRWFDRYWVAPFVEAAWKEAKGIPIEQGTG